MMHHHEHAKLVHHALELGGFVNSATVRLSILNSIPTCWTYAKRASLAEGFQGTLIIAHNPK